jgi:uncharacterized protein
LAIEKGEIALITGASSGLGAEFARQLATREYNLVLTSRREERLRQLAASIQTVHPVEIQIQPADLSKYADIDVLASLISSLPRLDLLVNNAGFGTVGKFYRVDPEKELAMLNVHMTAMVMLSRAALPGMVSRNHGGIINVASMAGFIPIRNVLYHSTKAYQISFSEALRSELLGSQVHVQALCPGFTITEFHDTPEYARYTRKSIPRFLWMTAEQVVAESLRSLDHGKLICIPGGIYRIAGAFARNSFTASIIKYVATKYISLQKA